MGWVIAWGITLALGLFFWWVCHFKQDRENQVNPAFILDGAAYTNASVIDRLET